MDRAYTWQQIAPLDDFTPPPFPLECFPEPLSDYGRALAEYTQTDPAMAGVLLLGLMGGLFQNKYAVVSVNGNVEQLSIYAVAVAPPAERKSEVIHRVIKPLEDFEESYNETHADDVSRSKTHRKKLEQFYDEAEKRGDGEEMFSTQAALDHFREIKPLTLLADDTTPEALVSLMKDNGERVLISSDEGGIFTHMKGRYKQNGDDRQAYLKGHSGGRVIVHRKSREPETLKNAAISMMIAVQPFILENVILEEENNGRGLTARLAFAACAEKAGSRSAVSAALPADTVWAYECAVKNCLKKTVVFQPDGKPPAARLIHLSDEACKLAAGYFGGMEKRIADGLERAKGWNGKAFGLLVRVAGLFHAFECIERGVEPEMIPLPDTTLTAAFIVTECLAAHAERVFAGSDKKTSDAKYLLGRIGEMGAEFNKRELMIKVRGRLQSSETLDAALKVLEECGYICIEEIPTAGRPLTKILVNPAINSP